MNHWTDNRIFKMERLLAAARDILDLELEQDIPESFATEWAALAYAVQSLRDSDPPKVENNPLTL